MYQLVYCFELPQWTDNSTKQWPKQRRTYLFFLYNKNSSGWWSRLGVIAQGTTGAPGSLSLDVAPSLVCGSYPHSHKMTPETWCIERILKTGTRGKAKEACQLTLFPFKALLQKHTPWHLLCISLVWSGLCHLWRRLANVVLISPAHCHLQQKLSWVRRKGMAVALGMNWGQNSHCGIMVPPPH